MMFIKGFISILSKISLDSSEIVLSAIDGLLKDLSSVYVLPMKHNFTPSFPNCLSASSHQNLDELIISSAYHLWINQRPSPNISMLLKLTSTYLST